MNPKKILTMASISLLTVACASSSTTASSKAPESRPVAQSTSESQFPASVTSTTVSSHNASTDGITMEKIMSDPDWLGRQPSAAYWADDSTGIFYSRKREGSVVQDLFKGDMSGKSNGTLVEDQELHKVSYRSRVLNDTGNLAAWVYKGNLFIKDLSSGQVRQLTRGKARESSPQFLLDGRIAYRVSNTLFAMDLTSGYTTEIADFQEADAPEGVKPPKDYVAEQHQKLINFVQVQRKNKQDKLDRDEEIRKSDNSLEAKPFYFGKGNSIDRVSLSPNGQYAIVAVSKSSSWRGKSDIMPNYITEDGRIDPVPARRRVADAKSSGQTIWFVDLTSHEKTELSYKALPGYNEDVLADVKTEVAARNGEEYEVNRLPRDINLISDWYWSQSPIQWHQNGRHVAIMLEAWDNKDRWITTVTPETKTFKTQHRLHDKAWINYKLNSFGWIKNTTDLYYLSEESGYANLYRKSLDSEPKAIASGQFVVDSLSFTSDGQYVFYKANKKHPGIYEIYKHNLSTGEDLAVTDLNGMTDYVLSPDGQKLLLTHSKTTQPPELFVTDTKGGDVLRLTHTVSDEFNSMKWSVAQVIKVPSSDIDRSVFARLYLPKGWNANSDKQYKAVIFTHGAGYLQNAHMGWSSYFREFMFHSLLNRHGYVVLDIDYRGSAGYGRDWRTAIYRQMGTPEVQDLEDSANWLVENASVDKNRIGTYGGSYGGFLTFMSLFKKPDLFKAGAALRPVTDWAHYNTPYTANILNTPDVDPIAYERSSPIYFAEGLKGALLINAPMVDDNVFFQDTVRLVQRLIELKKENFETAIFPVEPHTFVQPTSWLDEYRRIFKLFENNL